MKTLLKNESDIRQTLVTDNSDDNRLTFVTEQDIDPILRSVAMRKETENLQGDFRPVAEIPAVVVEQMMREGSWNDPAALKKWLNDPQNKCFRIWEGKV